MAVITKMQVLYAAKLEPSQTLADLLGKQFKCKSDKIPPAYPCEGQTLVCIVAENYGGKCSSALVNFCKDLTTNRVKNVCVISVSNGDSNVEPVKNVLEANGVKYVGEKALVIKHSLFSKGKLTQSEVDESVKFIQKKIDEIVK